MTNDSAGRTHRPQIRDCTLAVALEEIPYSGGDGFTSGNRGLITGLFGILVHD